MGNSPLNTNLWEIFAPDTSLGNVHKKGTTISGSILVSCLTWLARHELLKITLLYVLLVRIGE